MSTAHFFYLPVLVLVGVFAGFYLGKQSAEDELREKFKAKRRKEQLQKRAAKLEEQASSQGAETQAD